MEVMEDGDGRVLWRDDELEETASTEVSFEYKLYSRAKHYSRS